MHIALFDIDSKRAARAWRARRVSNEEQQRYAPRAPDAHGAFPMNSSKDIPYISVRIAVQIGLLDIEIGVSSSEAGCMDCKANPLSIESRLPTSESVLHESD